MPLLNQQEVHLLLGTPGSIYDVERGVEVFNGTRLIPLAGRGVGLRTRPSVWKSAGAHHAVLEP